MTAAVITAVFAIIVLVVGYLLFDPKDWKR